MGNFIAYARVSTEAQRNNTSIDDQLTKLSEWGKNTGNVIAHELWERGSGADFDRRMLRTALEAVRENESIDGLVVASLDRLGRDARQLLGLLDDYFLRGGKTLVVVNLPADFSSWVGRAMFTFFATMAEMERAMTRQRTQDGRSFKDRVGGYAFGAPPFGKEAKAGALHDVESESKIITSIIHYRRGGLSLQKIADALNRRGLKPKRGKLWHPSSVRNVLQKFKGLLDQ